MESRFRFQSERPFQQVLQLRVEERLAALGRSRYGAARLYLKTVVILLWTGLSYAGLLAADRWWQVLPLAASLGLALAAIGFNVGHDANHGAGSPCMTCWEAAPTSGGSSTTSSTTATRT